MGWRAHPRLPPRRPGTRSARGQAGALSRPDGVASRARSGPDPRRPRPRVAAGRVEPNLLRRHVRRRLLRQSRVCTSDSRRPPSAGNGLCRNLGDRRQEHRSTGTGVRRRLCRGTTCAKSSEAGSWTCSRTRGLIQLCHGWVWPRRGMRSRDRKPISKRTSGTQARRLLTRGIYGAREVALVQQAGSLRL